MVSVITGDIIDSRNVPKPRRWLATLKKVLNTFGRSPKIWEIYRGDSFQLEIKDVYAAFEATILIKASIRTIRDLDVRMAIGVGEKTYHAKKITESNGEAFVFSGEKFEGLKREKQNLAIKTSSETFDEEINLYFRLALIAMDNWTPNSAEMVLLSMKNPGISQEELGKIIGIRQNTVSERQKRSYLDEIIALNAMYKKKVEQLQKF